MNRVSLNMTFILRAVAMVRYICTALLLVAGMRAVAVAGVLLELSPEREQVYTSEAMPVTVTLRVSDATVRNIGYPRLAAPGGRTVAFAPPAQHPDPRDPNATLYRFDGQISSAKPGTLIVGPATLDCEIMEPAKGSAAFFGGQEPHVVKLASTPATFEVLPLPAAGKPAHFSGAIGTFSLSVKTVPEQVAVGEPLTVTTTIRGTGSLADAGCPPLVDSAMQSFPVRAMRSKSQLICEQVVMPNREMRVPPVTWSYFDPKRGLYRVLKGNVGSRVMAQPPATDPQSASPTAPAANDPHSRKSAVNSSRLPAAIAAVIVFLGGIAAILRKRNKLNQKQTLPEIPSDIHGMLQAAEEAAFNGDVEIFYNNAFSIIHYVVNPYNRATSGISAPYYRPDLSTTTGKHHNFNEIRSITEACDKVRYGRIMPDRITLQSDLNRLKQLLPSTQ